MGAPPPFAKLRHLLRSNPDVVNVFGSATLRSLYPGAWAPSTIDLCVLCDGTALQHVLQILRRGLGGTAAPEHRGTHHLVRADNGLIVNVYNPTCTLETFLRSLELQESGIVFNLRSGLWEVPDAMLTEAEAEAPSWAPARLNRETRRWEIPDRLVRSGGLPKSWTFLKLGADAFLRRHPAVEPDHLGTSFHERDRDENIAQARRRARLSGVELRAKVFNDDDDDVLDARTDDWCDGWS